MLKKGTTAKTKAVDRVKRSVTVRRDIDAAVIKIVGSREYSAFVNEALVLALQTEGLRESILEFEGDHGALTAREKRIARERRTNAMERAR